MVKLTLGLCAFILSSTSLLMLITAVVIPYWAVVTDEDGLTRSVGLWQICYMYEGRHWCLDPSVPDFLQGVRVCEVLGMLSIALAVGCWSLKRFVWTTQNKLLKAGYVLSLSAGILITTGIIVYGVKLHDTVDGLLFSDKKCRFHAAFGLCVAAAAFAIASGVVFFKWEKRTREEDEDDVSLIDSSPIRAAQ